MHDRSIHMVIVSCQCTLIRVRIKIIEYSSAHRYGCVSVFIFTYARPSTHLKQNIFFYRLCLFLFLTLCVHFIFILSCFFFICRQPSRGCQQYCCYYCFVFSFFYAYFICYCIFYSSFILVQSSVDYSRKSNAKLDSNIELMFWWHNFSESQDEKQMKIMKQIEHNEFCNLCKGKIYMVISVCIRLPSNDVIEIYLILLNFIISSLRYELDRSSQWKKNILGSNLNKLRK